MTTLNESEKRELARLPEALRRLLDAELAAGNEIVELGYGFPAAPAGFYILLRKEVCSRPRESSDGVDFYDRDMPRYSGEYTTGPRHFFILEPPHPPKPEPDMDAIRAAMEARQNAELPPPVVEARRVREAQSVEAAAAAREAEMAPDGSALKKFEKSMSIDYEKWHDGIGYDLDSIATASPAELKAIEQLLIPRAMNDWRDVEALALLDSPGARKALKQAFVNGKSEIRLAVLRYAPQLVTSAERTRMIVDTIPVVKPYEGLVALLSQVEEHHPKPVLEALLHATLHGNNNVAAHFAAMLMFLYEKAPCAFDMAQRPFFLRFNTPDRGAREAAFRELCDKIGVNPARFLKN